MLPASPVETLTLPAPAPEPSRPPFPWIATAAPVAVSVALWAVTGSPFGLLFAVLGPVVAVGGVIDGARTRRRTARRERVRFEAAVERCSEQIDSAHERERERLRALADGDWGEATPRSLLVRVGTGDVPGVLHATGADPDEPAHDLLLRRASTVTRAPLLVDARGGVGVTGPPPLARAVARALTLQLARRLPPGAARLAVPAGETWAAQLPHAVSPSEQPAFAWDEGPVVAWAADAAGLPAGCSVVLDATTAHAVTTATAAHEAQLLAERAAAHGLSSAARLPDAVSWERIAPSVPGAGLSAVVGMGERGEVALDLVADGPHALVAGTTGSGKSELLVSWVLGMAAGRAPSEVAFVLVDFKGGAAFAPLAGLPHVVATLSDLDARLTLRAVESLRGELLRRERVLAEHAVRDIGELAAGVLPRLVVVVDEFAALTADRPELHEVIADLAARGRSLGMHLVLCTQRPSGVVRDAVLANIGLRISLRVADRADSIAMVGDDAAARLPVSPRGRAIVCLPDGTTEVQVALADAASIARVAATPVHGSAAQPWCDPLPAQLDLDDLPSASSGLAFGLGDLPAELRQPVAAHDPARHGHLLIVGAAGAGATTAAATLAEAARRSARRVHVVSADPVEAWAQLEQPERLRDGLLVLDGLDALLGRMDSDYRHEFAERLVALLRDPSPGAPEAVVTARRITGPLAGMTGLFGSRLLLRQASRDDQVLAGGAHGDWDPEAPPGAGVWRGMPVQVARFGTGSLPPPSVPQPEIVTLASHPLLAIVASRPHALRAALRDGGARVIELGASGVLGEEGSASDRVRVQTAGEPTVVLGDPDAWLADWSMLPVARREWPIVLVGCTAADVRAVVRDRQTPPLLGADPDECWLARDGRTRRARLDLGARSGGLLGEPGANARDSEEERGQNR